MKAEKIEKHMRKRTVVRGQDTASTVFGVITEDDGSTTPPLRVEGCLVDGACNVYDYDWFNTHEVRKATDDERAAFFAWIVSDGSDIADGFARFGGAPRGFAEWRTALLSGEPAPEPVEPPALKHERGDLRVCYPAVSTGLSNVGRVTSVNDDGDPTIEGALRCECCAYEPTRENVAMLVAKQRERGVEPEVGDLVYMMGRETGGMLGRIAFVSSGVGAAMTLACAGTTAQITAHPNLLILVIRRNPMRELGDE